ncbi:MAG TPA: hypothetical protein VG055_31135 [Planctomycetaceae bacterium]|jgi:hypothetical protein|nr:hypothetical protein [Planctomycetaceae bacterium]
MDPRMRFAAARLSDQWKASREAHGCAKQNMRGYRFIVWILLCGTALVAASLSPAARGEETKPAAGDQPQWRVYKTLGQIQHRRGPQLGYAEAPGEEIVVEGSRATEIYIDRPLPKPGRTLPELKAVVWVRANRVGAQLYFHVVFPRQIDPTTGHLLDTHIKGGEYTDAGCWQQLICGTPDKEMQSEIRKLRWKFRSEPIDVSGSYVDRVVMTCPLGPEQFRIALGDPQVEQLIEAGTQTPPEQSRQLRPTAEIHQGQLTIGGRPRLAIMAIDHGEDLETYRQLHVNTVWMRVRNAEERARLAALHERGIFAAAAPPTDPAPVEQLSSDGMRATPRAYGSPEIQIWYLGTWMSSQDREEVMALTEQLRSHDYRLRRPTLIDVIEEERGYSRYVSMLGTSRHVFGTAFTFRDYRNWLMERSRLANPGTFLFTWIQTEPVPASNDWRIESKLTPAVLEPEQIRQQLYAAIMAGYRGFGYWNRTSLESNAPGAIERRLQLAQLNLELELIEPFLATANLAEAATFRIDQKTPKATRKLVDFPRDASDLTKTIRQKLAENNTQLKNQKLMPQETVAAVFGGSNYSLVVAAWLSHDAQYVPGKLAAYDAKVLIPEPSPNARFWELTTTRLRPLTKEKTVGHYLVTLPKFDQSAIILVSSDPGWRDQVEQHIQQIAPASAQISIDLAKAKLTRVRQVDAELTQLGSGQPDGPAMLSRAERCIQDAEAAYRIHDFETARSSAGDAMQLLRVLEYAHWNEAVTQGEYGPISSPYSICFQTLPEHLRLIQRLGRTADNPQDNQLPSGDFESQNAIRAGWTQTQHSIEGVSATAETYPSPRKGKSALRLIAIPTTGIDAPEIFSKPPVSVSSPPMPVRKGQILHVSGWVKVIAPPSRSLDAISVHDNLDRMLGALRFTEKCGWQRFQFLREVRADGPYILTLTLHGMGEVLFDDLQVIPHQVATIRAASESDPSFERPATPYGSTSSAIGNPMQSLRPARTR